LSGRFGTFSGFMRVRLISVLTASAVSTALGQSESLVDLPALTVNSPRVALQEPVGTFAMPVSALRFEPQVDVQGRNMAEGQADIAIRGGIFENTGFRVGAVSLYDPMTGHYFAEIPVSPSMLTAPAVLTGADNAWRGWNANAGSIAYSWRLIRQTGLISVSAGEYDTQRGELYQGVVAPQPLWGGRLAADFSVGYSRSDGSRPWGESEFSRYNVRFQLQREASQTDLFYGVQSKEFGWPNLYTPFANVYETEDVRTALLALNHHVRLAGGDYISVGGYYRYNNDHYVFNRADPGAYNAAFATGPAFHRTWVYGAGLEGRVTTGDVRWNLNGAFVDDEIKSSSLTFGRYRTRQHLKVAVVPEYSWELPNARTATVKAGAAFDDTDRDASSVSPVAEFAIDQVAPAAGVNRVYASFARSTQTSTYFALNSNPSRGLFRGNPNLQRQIAKNFEIGASGGRGPWTAHAAVFHRKDDRLVDWTYSSSAVNARAANPVDIDTTGFETVVRYGTKTVDVVFGYAALNKEADYGTAVVDASFYALNFPEHRVTLAVVGRLGAGWELRMDNEYRVQEKNALRRSGRTPFISSAGIYYSVRAVPGLRLSAEVENLWDSDFEEVPAVPAARRQISVGVVYAW
jgi:vitamin B12 transporter